MKFKNFQIKRTLIQEEINLIEKLIVINNGANYGQIVFLAGGAGSGKGFAVAKFLEGNKFKVRDVDEWKRLYKKINKLNFDMRNPADVAKLHELVDNANIKDKTLELLLKDVESNTLPNIIFDITAKNVKSIYNTADQLLKAGYKVENINIVWVLTNYDVAATANKKRARVVPDDILLDTHFGASETMTNIIFKNLDSSLVDGSIYVILNNREETKAYKPTGMQREIKPGESKELYNQMMLNVEDFTYIQVKKPKQSVKMDDKMSEKVKTWIEVNTPERMYAPKYKTEEEILNAPGYLETVNVGSGLVAYIHDSDPFDAITYSINGDITATEYRSDYKRRIKDIKNDVPSFIETLKNYKR